MTRFFSNKPFFFILVSSFFVLSVLTMNSHLYGSPNDPHASEGNSSHVVSFAPSHSLIPQPEEAGSCCSRTLKRVNEIWSYVQKPLQVGALAAVLLLTYPFPYGW